MNLREEVEQLIKQSDDPALFEQSVARVKELMGKMTPRILKALQDKGPVISQYLEIAKKTVQLGMACIVFVRALKEGRERRRLDARAGSPAPSEETPSDGETATQPGM